MATLDSMILSGHDRPAPPTLPHVQVWVGGVLVADTEPSMLLFQAGMPVRYYLPKLYARLDVLVPSATRMRCSDEGYVVYWSAQIGAERYDDIAWSHPVPVPGVPGIEDMIAFFNEKTDIIVDGVPAGRGRNGRKITYPG